MAHQAGYDELVELILHGAEERNLEYKASMNWNEVETKSKVTRAAMSMANIRDGGVIIFGVNEISRGVFEPCGMSPEDADSFNQDDVQSSVNKYADPFVDMTVDRVEYRGRSFIVIQVSEFEELPVVTKKSGVNIKRGEIYTRSRRKNESAPVSSQTEMREILEISFDKRMRRYREQFFRWGMFKLISPDEIETERFNQEIKEEQLAAHIQPIINSAHWVIRIRPAKFLENRIESLSGLHRLLENNAVRLRGLPYPALGLVENRKNWIESTVERDGHLELLRYYQSGQYLHYIKIDSSHGELCNDCGKEAAGYLAVLPILHRLTEIFEFAGRLAEQQVFGKQLTVDIALRKINGFQLFYRGPGRRVLGEYRSRMDTIELHKELSVEELLVRSGSVAIDQAVHLFERFNWSEPPRQLFVEEQRKFLQRR